MQVMSYLRPRETQTPRMWLRERNPNWLTDIGRFFHSSWSPGQRSHIQKAAGGRRVSARAKILEACYDAFKNKGLGSSSVIMSLVFMNVEYFVTWIVKVNGPG